MHKEYILLNGFRKAKRGFTAGFHVPLNTFECKRRMEVMSFWEISDIHDTRVRFH